MERLDALEDQSRVGRTLSNLENLVDRIYICASTLDSRYTRICVASIRYFYPDVPIRLLVGGPLQRGLADEVQRHWNVGTADLPRGDYGWGFVKLEPLFGRSSEKFLVLDSDTVLTGQVLDIWSESPASFLVDDEEQSEADTKRLYYDWEKVRKIDPNARPPRFVFNSGQWFGTAGVLTRADFAPWVEWTIPRRLRYPEHFMPGDQGILNYVLNQKAAIDGLCVERRQIMRWPGHAMDGLDVESVSKRAAAPLVVHWAGVKKARQRDMIGADLLAYFEKVYYQRLPAGNARRFFAGCRDSFSHSLLGAKVRVKLACRKLGAVRRAPVPR
jgi:hypothetical protein